MDLLSAGTIIIIIAAAIVDVREGKIPNALLICLLGVITTSEIISIILKNPVMTGKEVVENLLFSLFVMGLLYPFFLIGGLGAGDIKLICIVMLTLSRPVIFLIETFLLALLVGIIKIIIEKGLKRKEKHSKTIVHLAVPVLIAYYLAVCI